MSRCRSWRPVPDVDRTHAQHLPGECRVCWKPCFAHVETGQARCQECEELLRAHTSSIVRASLATEPGVSYGTLHLLTGDEDMTVSNIATKALRRYQHG